MFAQAAVLLSVAVLFGVGVPTSSTGTPPAPAAEHTMRVCMGCTWDEFGTQHRGAENGWIVQGIIHASWVSGSCSADGHISCADSKAFLREDGGFRRLIAAAETGDSDEILRVVRSASSADLEWDASEGVIRVLGCEGGIYAVMTLRSDVQRALQVASSEGALRD